MDLEFEPLPPGPPALPQTDVRAAWRARRRALRAERRVAAELRARSWRRLVPPMSRSFAISLASHAAVFALIALLWALRPDVPRERLVTVRIDLASLVEAADPEATAGGASPRAESPQDAAQGARSDAPGNQFDFANESASVGAGGAPAGSVLLGRTEGRERLLQAGGGDGATEGAVRLALAWLARHQAPDGTWSATTFRSRCAGPACDGPGDTDHTDAVTALALLPFLGAGHTHRDGPWKDVVRRGLTALVARQRPDGSFGASSGGGFAGGPKPGYATAIGAAALADAYGLTGSPALRGPAERAAAFLVATQSRRGGWRYEPGDGETDSSVTGWAAVALASARRAGLAVPAASLDSARSWFAEVTDTTGDVGYTGRGGGSAALLGSGAFARIVLGTDPADPALAATFERLERRLPRVPRPGGDPAEEYGPADPMHWYAGSLAAFQRGGGTWTVWNERLRATLLPSQVRDASDARGSWPAFGATGRHGGRVVVTALGALSLEVYYRYPRAAWR